MYDILGSRYHLDRHEVTGDIDSARIVTSVQTISRNDTFFFFSFVCLKRETGPREWKIAWIFFDTYQRIRTHNESCPIKKSNIVPFLSSFDASLFYSFFFFSFYFDWPVYMSNQIQTETPNHGSKCMCDWYRWHTRITWLHFVWISISKLTRILRSAARKSNWSTVFPENTIRLCIYIVFFLNFEV